MRRRNLADTYRLGAGSMKIAVVTPSDLLTMTFRVGLVMQMRAPSSTRELACAAISAMAPLACGTSPCEARQRPWLSTHITPSTPGDCIAVSQTPSMGRRTSAAPDRARASASAEQGSDAYKEKKFAKTKKVPPGALFTITTPLSL